MTNLYIKKHVVDITNYWFNLIYLKNIIKALCTKKLNGDQKH